MASLDAALQKATRAAEHLKVLQSETLRFLQEGPGELLSTTERESNGLLIGSGVSPAIPARIPLIIGDVLHNLRSSLDYLIWELVLANGYLPTNKNAFPICDVQAAFKMELRRHRLDGIPAPARTTIEGLQPYRDGERREHNNLRVLDELSGISRHRGVSLSAVTVLDSGLELDSNAGSYADSFVPALHQSSETGVCLYPASHRVRDGQLVRFIAFGDGPAKGVELGLCLDRLWHWVSDVVLPQFEGYFA